MKAKEFNSGVVRGQTAAGRRVPALRRKYEAVLRGNAKKTRRAYESVTAAALPTEDASKLLDENALKVSITARTAAERKRMAAAVATPLVGKQARSFFDATLRTTETAQAEAATKAVRDALTKVISDSLAEGWSVPETAETIETTLTDYAVWEAERLARTDLVSISNAISLESAKLLGDAAPPFKRWLSAGDAKVRETHREADGQTVGREKTFSVGGFPMDHPGDFLAPYAETMNCRCTQIYLDTATASLAHSFEGGIVEDPIALAASAWEDVEWALVAANPYHDKVGRFDFGGAHGHPTRPGGGSLRTRVVDDIGEQAEIAMDAIDPYSPESLFSSWPDADKQLVSEMGGSIGKNWEWDGEEPIAISTLSNGNPAVELMTVESGELHTSSYRMRAISSFRRAEDGVYANHFVTDGSGVGPARSLIKKLAGVAEAEDKPLFGSPADDHLRRQYERLGGVSQPDGTVKWDVGSLRALTSSAWDASVPPVTLYEMDPLEANPNAVVLEIIDQAVEAIIEGESGRALSILVDAIGILQPDDGMVAAVFAAKRDPITAALIRPQIEIIEEPVLEWDPDLAHPPDSVPVAGIIEEAHQLHQGNGRANHRFGAITPTEYDSVRAARELGLSGMNGITAAGFDKQKHPRHPKGDPLGGKFRPKALGALAPGDKVLTETGNPDVPMINTVSSVEEAADGSVVKFSDGTAIAGDPSQDVLAQDAREGMVAKPENLTESIQYSLATMPLSSGVTDPEMITVHKILRKKFGMNPDVFVRGDQPDSLTSSGAPLAPPDEWFDDPELEEPTPLTVTADGRVYGHLGEWGKCHTGIGGRCVMIPRTRNGYADFHNGGLVLASGNEIRVGKLTLDTGHAPLQAGASRASAHYDHTGHVGAFVRAGEDEFGPWLAGAVRSDATPEMIRDLRANPPSGDWRKLAGRAGLELIAALAVPVQGFPVAALSASGEITAFVSGWDDTGDLALVASAEVEDLEREFQLLVARLDGMEGLAALVAANPYHDKVGRFDFSMRAREAKALRNTNEIDDPPVFRDEVGREEGAPTYGSPTHAVGDRVRTGEGHLGEVVGHTHSGSMVQVRREMDGVVESHDPSTITREGSRAAKLPPREKAMVAAGVRITIEVDGDDPVVVADASLDREIGLRVDYFRDHGYWPEDPLAGGTLTDAEFETAIAASALMIEHPDSPSSVELRGRLVGKGLLV